MPPGKGVITPSTSSIALHRALAGGEHRRVRLAEHEQIAAADRLLGQAGGRLAEELAVHHRDAPESPPRHQLRHLPAVAEESERGAELQLLLAFEPGEAGRTGAGQHALADAVAQLPLQLLGVHGEEQHGDAGAAVERLVGREHALDAGLRAAGDHRGGEAGHGAGGDQRPFERGRGDDDARADHRKGLGEGLDDGDAFDLQFGHGRAVWTRLQVGTPNRKDRRHSRAPLNRWLEPRKRAIKAVRPWACRI